MSGINLEALQENFDRMEAIRQLTSIDMRTMQMAIGRRNTPSYDEIRSQFEAMTDEELKENIADCLL